ncbi:hypothetical protein [Piscirickettsia salmonis]
MLCTPWLAALVESTLSSYSILVLVKQSCHSLGARKHETHYC